LGEPRASERAERPLESTELSLPPLTEYLAGGRRENCPQAGKPQPARPLWSELKITEPIGGVILIERELIEARFGWGTSGGKSGLLLLRGGRGGFTPPRRGRGRAAARPSPKRARNEPETSPPAGGRVGQESGSEKETKPKLFFKRPAGRRGLSRGGRQ